MTPPRPSSARQGGASGAPAEAPSRRVAFHRSRWRMADRTLALESPVVMGVLNLTPDSFSDGGEIESIPAALERAEALVQGGAAILDVGGESTRPGADPVPVDVEHARVIPFGREAARRFSVPISIDTRSAAVARAAIDEGAVVVNDVSGLAHDPEMAALVAERGVGVVLMHMRGTPADMRERTAYDNLLEEVTAELRCAIDRARAAGVRDEAIVLDPGLGFAKTARQTLTLLARLDELVSLGFPVLIGPSRKSFLGNVLDLPPKERIEGTIASCVSAYLRGARIFRVHDAEAVARALAVAAAIEAEGEAE